MNREEITELYSNQAGGLRAKGRYKDAERLDCGIVASECFFVFFLHKIVFVLILMLNMAPFQKLLRFSFFVDFSNESSMA